MKSFSSLVNKHFKVHIKRGILTIIGIISSIIMLFTIGYLSNYIDEIDILSVKKDYGDYEANIKDIDIENAEKIINNIKVDRGGIYKRIKEIDLKVGNTIKKLEIYSCDYGAMNEVFYNKLEIMEGREPKTAKEIVLSDSVKEQLEYNLGDQVNFDGLIYEIVGFYQEDNYRNYNLLSGVTILEDPKLYETVDVAFGIKGKKKSKQDIAAVINDSGLDYSNLVNSNKIAFNTIFLNKGRMFLSGNADVIDNRALSVMALNGFVFILTIFLTYGAINISLNERKKQFAILRCIGATPFKIKTLLIKESIILGLCSLIPGIIIAQIVSWLIVDIAFRNVIEVTQLGRKIYFDVIINTSLLIALNIFCATIIPLMRVGKISPIELVKTKDVKSRRIKKKSSKTIRRILGYPGELAYKNIRSNNKKFIITTTTLTIVLVGITVLNGYRLINEKAYEKKIEKMKDISISARMINSQESWHKTLERVIMDSDSFKAGVEDLKVTSELYSTLKIGGSGIFKGTFYNNAGEGNYRIKNYTKDGEEYFYTDLVLLLALNEEHLNEIIPYINDGNLSEGEFKKDDFILINSKNIKNVLTSNNESSLTAKVGDSVELYFIDGLEGEEINGEELEGIQPLKMNYRGTIDSEDLLNSDRFGYYQYIAIVVSEDFLRENKELLDLVYNSTLELAFNIDEGQNKENAVQEIKKYTNLNNAYYTEEKESVIEEFKSIELSFVLINSALVLIVIMSTINIINNRSINISLRKKELSALLSIGMKKSQVMKMIFLEDILEWGISSLIGGTISIIILKIMNSWFIKLSNMKELISPYPIVLLNIGFLLILTLITNIVPYNKLKDLQLGELLNNEE